MRGNPNEILLQVGEAYQALFEERHRLLGKTNSFVIELMHHGDDGMVFVPRHGLGKVEDGIERVKQIAMPMLLQYAPKAFNGIVLAVIRRIVNQLERELQLVSELDHAVHELRASAMIFGSIVLEEHQRLYLRELVGDLSPAVE